MKRRYLWIAAAILWMLFIWSNSLQTATESSEVSRDVLGWFTPLLAQTGIPEEFWHSLIRKLAHMTEFAVLGVLWSAGLRAEAKPIPRVQWMRRGATLLICLAAACVDETIQRFVPGRSGELRDVCIDLLGSVLGVLVTMVIGKVMRPKHRKV